MKTFMALGAALFLCLMAQAASAQNVMCATQVCANTSHYLSAASTNATSVKGAPGAVYSIVAVNTSATLYYLKLYDKATAPACNSDTVIATFPLPAAATGGYPVVVQPSAGLGFNNGIGFCITGGIADNDNTNAATGIAVAISYR